MTEMVLNTNTLPEPLFVLIRTEKVKVCETQGEIRLIPIRETNKECPFLGMFADGKLSSERFIAEKQIEKGLEL